MKKPIVHFGSFNKHFIDRLGWNIYCWGMKACLELIFNISLNVKPPALTASLINTLTAALL